jgi:UDP-glucose 4-epimerase
LILSLASLLAEFAPDAVVHLAAQASVSESMRDPERDWAVNAEGTRRVAAAARECGARRVISVSSAAVYGEPDESDLPLGETADKAPANPYGRSKLAAEALLAAELAGSPTDYAAFRFSNVYGPRQDGAGEGGVVAIFCTKLAAGETPVIYGTGEQTRDFIFVGDVVEAILSAILSPAALATAGGGEDAASYNISTGIETSVNQLLGAASAASGWARGAVREPGREGDVARSALDPGKARRVLGWQANCSLEEGISATWEWFRGNR